MSVPKCLLCVIIRNSPASEPSRVDLKRPAYSVSAGENPAICRIETIGLIRDGPTAQLQSAHRPFSPLGGSWIESRLNPGECPHDPNYCDSERNLIPAGGPLGYPRQYLYSCLSTNATSSCRAAFRRRKGRWMARLSRPRCPHTRSPGRLFASAAVRLVPGRRAEASR